MKNVKIEILSNVKTTEDMWGGLAFTDTTVGKVYDAIILEDLEITPAPWAQYRNQENEDASILFLDDKGDACSMDYDPTVDVYFKVLEEV